jgi:Family of unknown function (DUF5681)
MAAIKRNAGDHTPKQHRNLKESWKPGQSGNPMGRPKGARNRLGRAFLEALEADFSEHGVEAIEKVRETKPEVYIKIVADLLPKEANLNMDNGEAFTKLWRLISDGLGKEALRAMEAQEALEAEEGEDTVH